ncbi:hypothetical protein Leryth_006336 [Lithospermum erythrorhizon]|nr:hypothetical protein Leryth_006336 [Lithospermum erythrorhizon]
MVNHILITLIQQDPKSKFHLFNLSPITKTEVQWEARGGVGEGEGEAYGGGVEELPPGTEEGGGGVWWWR